METTREDGERHGVKQPWPARARRALSAYFAKRHVRFGLALALAVFAADQATKALLLYGVGLKAFAPGEAIEIAPFFNLVMVWNEGVSFGLLPAGTLWGKALLVVFALAVAGVLSVWLNGANRGILAAAIGSVIGGALGNVVDRLVYGAVADFFDVHAFGYHWYTFNVADMFIVLGVGLLILDSLTGEPARKPASGNKVRGGGRKHGSEAQ
ncbi:MAG: signal peptidase II [Alphaproteobacteria bacterium]